MKIFSDTDPTINLYEGQTPSDLLKTLEGQTLTTRVIQVFPNQNVLLNLGNQSLLAHTKVPLKAGQELQTKVIAQNNQFNLQILQQSETKDFSFKAQTSTPQALKTFLQDHQIIPNERNLNSAQALLNTGVPLNKENLESIIRISKQLNLQKKEDFSSLALALKNEILPLKTKLSNISKLLSNTQNPLPQNSPPPNTQPIASRPNSPLPPLSELLPKETLPQTSPKEVQAITELIQTTHKLHPLQSENKVVKDLSKTLFNPTEFIKSYPNIKETLKNLKNIYPPPSSTPQIKTSPQTIPTPPMEELINTTTLSLDKLFEKVSTTPLAEKDNAFPEDHLNSFLKELDRIFFRGTMDQFKPSFTHNTLSENKAQSLDQLFNQLDQALKKIFTPTNKEIETTFKNNQTGLDLGEDIKSLLEKRLRQINTPSLEEQTPQKNEPPNKNQPIHQQLKEALEGTLKQIESEQTKHLLQNDPLLPDTLIRIPINLIDGEKNTEIELFFQSGTNQNKKNKEGKKPFEIFFSMELSELGNFQIQVYEFDKSMEVFLLSPIPDTQKLFQEHSHELKKNLKQLGLKNVQFRLINKTAQDEEAPPTSPSVQPIQKRKGIDIEA